MTQLAIIGHKTRDKEVIEILEMLGYINLHNYVANCDSLCFYGGKSTNGIYYDWVNDCYEDEDVTVFTLEEFLEKYPYKVGDKVTVTGLPEYPKIINFMEWFDGDIHYSFDNETWFLPSELILYKEETMEVKRMAFAIAGHKTRGKEVIEILEMLGGENKEGYCGYNPNVAYYISHQNTIVCDCDCDCYTLEEFLKKFPYKVGDRVSSKYLKNYKIEKMEWENTDNRVIYKLQGMGWYSADELQPYKEEAMDKVNKAIFDTNAQCCDISNHLIKKETMEEKLCIGLFPVSNGRKEIIPCDGYEVVSDNGKFYVVKKLPQYPKTYEECCKVLGYSGNYNMILTTDVDNKLFDALYRLKVCRDAYWKIIGDWKPDWSNDLSKYYISFYNNKVDKGVISYSNKILAFPTEEIRDTFYENFKDLIESCKELL